MADVVYVSKVRVERRPNGVREAWLPAESAPVLYGMHDAIAAHYGADPATLEPHASTIDHLVGATLG